MGKRVEVERPNQASRGLTRVIVCLFCVPSHLLFSLSEKHNHPCGPIGDETPARVKQYARMRSGDSTMSIYRNFLGSVALTLFARY